MDELKKVVLDVMDWLGIDMETIAKAYGGGMPAPHLMLGGTVSANTAIQTMKNIINDPNLNAVFWAELRDRDLYDKAITYILNYLLAMLDNNVEEVIRVTTIGDIAKGRKIDTVFVSERYNNTINVPLFFMVLSYTTYKE